MAVRRSLLDNASRILYYSRDRLSRFRSGRRQYRSCHNKITNKKMRRRYPSRVFIKIFDPDNKKWGGISYQADKGKVYTPPAIKAILDKTMNDLIKNFPSLEYKIFPVGNFQYNFVCTGLRSMKEQAENSNSNINNN